MKILCLSYDDYANFGHEIATSLLLVGCEVRSLKMKRHCFEYLQQATVASEEKIIEAIKWADVIQIFHSSVKCLELVQNHAGGKAITVWHTGSPYRRDPEGMNKLFNPWVRMSFTDQTEFMQLGASNLQYCAAAIHTDRIRMSDKMPAAPYRFAHYPSNMEVKGSKEIREAMERLKESYPQRFTYDFSYERIPHPRQIDRMATCDIYLELFKPELDGKPYGCYGVTAFEAAALGKVVVTQSLFPVYRKAYGCDLPFWICNSITELDETLERLVISRPYEIRSRQHHTRQWLEKHHSYQATGTRVLSLLREAC